MFDGQLALTASLMTNLTLESIKFTVRKWFVKDPGYDFPERFYTLTLPFFTAVWSIVFGLVGWAEKIVFEPQALLQWALTILVTLALYHTGIQPYKAYRKKVNGS